MLAERGSHVCVLSCELSLLLMFRCERGPIAPADSLRGLVGCSITSSAEVVSDHCV